MTDDTDSTDPSGAAGRSPRWERDLLERLAFARMRVAQRDRLAHEVRREVVEHDPIGVRVERLAQPPFDPFQCFTITPILIMVIVHG